MSSSASSWPADVVLLQEVSRVRAPHRPNRTTYVFGGRGPSAGRVTSACACGRGGRDHVALVDLELQPSRAPLNGMTLAVKYHVLVGLSGVRSKTTAANQLRHAPALLLHVNVPLSVMSGNSPMKRLLISPVSSFMRRERRGVGDARVLAVLDGVLRRARTCGPRGVQAHCVSEEVLDRGDLLEDLLQARDLVESVLLAGGMRGDALLPCVRTDQPNPSRPRGSAIFANEIRRGARELVLLGAAEVREAAKEMKAR